MHIYRFIKTSFQRLQDGMEPRTLSTTACELSCPMCLEAGRIVLECVRLAELLSPLGTRNLALYASPLAHSGEGGQDERRNKCFNRRVPTNYVFRAPESQGIKCSR